MLALPVKKKKKKNQKKVMGYKKVFVSIAHSTINIHSWHFKQQRMIVIVVKLLGKPKTMGMPYSVIPTLTTAILSESFPKTSKS